MFTNLINVPVAVATTDTVATIGCATARVLGLEIKNTGANALDALELWGRFSSTGNLFKLAYLATDYTTPVYPVTKASASPVTLPAASSAWVVLDVSALAEVQVKASSSVGATTVEIHGCSKFST